MKKYLVISLLSFILGCFASSPKVAINIISTADFVKSSIELELSKLENEIKLISQSYKVEETTESKVEIKIKETIIVDNVQVIEAGFGDIFGCTPSKPVEEPKKEVKPSVPQTQVTPDLAVKVVPRVAKPNIVSVKNESTLVNGKMLLTKWNVKLNKEGLDKVKKGAKVRIFIGYCYYESGKIEKDGTVSFNIEWHPPLSRTEGKIGVSLFMQLNTPEIGSGIQYCSTVINI